MVGIYLAARDATLFWIYPVLAAAGSVIARGHTVRALTRNSFDTRLPPQTTLVKGNALEAGDGTREVAPEDTFVHLVGTPRPNPSKAQQFRDVDLASIRAAVTAATRAGVTHFVYVSVAQPAPVMKDYRRASRSRSADTSLGDERDDLASVVRARTGTLVALRAGSRLRNPQPHPVYRRRRPSAGTGDAPADCIGAGASSGTSAARRDDPRGSTDPVRLKADTTYVLP